MPLILGTNSIKDTGYEVDNSLRFNSGSTDYLSRTFGTSTNSKKFTWSFWIKRTNLSSGMYFFENVGSHGGDYAQGSILFDSSDRLQLFEDTFGSGSGMYLITNRKFRDVSAWYHIVIACDSTQATASNRAKIYVNGVQETSLATSTYPAQNHALPLVSGSGDPCNIGKYDNTNSNLDGYLAEIVFKDGSQLDPTSFGEFDSDTNIWIPKDLSDLDFSGTNTFHLDFENSSSLGADVSGNGNNFTVNNLTSIDQTTDTCTNNFATLNPLLNTNGLTFAEGNLQVATGGSDLFGACSTIGASQGKWYAEFKLTAFSSQNRFILGVTSDPAEDDREDKYMGQTSRSYAYSSEVGQKKHNDSGSSYGDSFGIGDIIGIALDLDNNKLYFSKNGTFQNSGDPTSGATGTGSAFDLTDPSSTASGFYFFAVSDESFSHQMTCQANFGNPPYSISSGNSDGNGYGNFEYAVPSGYYALCTKNLAEYG